MSHPFTAEDVLTKARDRLRNGPIDDACGPYCPWCAIAWAKGELDDEHGTGLTGIEVAVYMNTEVDSDLPLIEARRRLGPWNDVDPSMLDVERATVILSEALRG